MKYIINPYSQIILNNGKYNFYAPPSKITTIKIEIPVEEEQIDLLLANEGLSKEELIDILGEEKTNFLIEHEIFSALVPPDNEVASRTNQFFKQHLTVEEQKQIENSNVLVLGCGGIGSSIAWLLAGMGVKKMSIVDFDVVEASNLNRMFIFDRADIGRKKVIVIKDKLKNLYADIEIDAIDEKIVSETQLNTICSKVKYDLIIKALDSPTMFPVWLDSVCKKNKLCYIGGITLRDRVMIGPTYIPNIAENGWSDIVHTDALSERIFGKIPSICTMLFNATDRVAIEAVKILTEKYEACEYKNCIYSENIFSGEQEVIRSKKTRFKDNEIKKSTSLLNLISIFGFGCCTIYNSWLLILLIILSLLLPFFSYYGKKYILLQTFINLIISSLFLSAFILNSIGFNILTFCLVSIVMASIMSMIGLGINLVIIKILNIKRM